MTEEEEILEGITVELNKIAAILSYILEKVDTDEWRRSIR